MRSGCSASIISSGSRPPSAAWSRGVLRRPRRAPEGAGRSRLRVAQRDVGEGGPPAALQRVARVARQRHGQRRQDRRPEAGVLSRWHESRAAIVRTPDRPIDPLFVDRWSPRAMSGEPITRDELFQLFEAARWAPSSGNSQPWRMLYAHRDSPHWPRFFGLLASGNQTWCVTRRCSWSSSPRRSRGNRQAAAHAFLRHRIGAG